MYEHTFPLHFMCVFIWVTNRLSKMFLKVIKLKGVSIPTATYFQD